MPTVCSTGICLPTVIFLPGIGLQISKYAPGVALSIEKEGHTHGYCCTEAGSFWVADYVANLIKNQMLIGDS
jgi:hypothetical protein